MVPMTPAGKPDVNMIAWIAGRCDAPHYGELVVFELPKARWFAGPMQFENRIDQNTEISQEMTLWGQGGSTVLRGNTLIIPINGSLLYVEPVFLEAASRSGTGTGIPELKRVIVGYQDQVVMSATLAGALNEVFGEGAAPARTITGAAPPPPSEMAPPTPKPAPTTPPPGASGLPRERLARLRPLIKQALELDRQSQELLKKGDFAGFGAKQQELRRVLDRLDQVAK
jgi:uncharacterized membrane protein (UPF0182 family)